MLHKHVTQLKKTVILLFSFFLCLSSFAAVINVPGDYMSIQDAINNAMAGDTILVSMGTFKETSQVVVDRDITIIGAGKTSTILMPDFDTGASGDSRGWFLVEPDVEFNMHDLTLDGSGQLVYQAVRHKGNGEFNNVQFTEIKYNESGPHYNGVGIAAFGGTNNNVNVLNSMFSEMGRIGVLYFGTGVTDALFKGNMYTGKGSGDHLDYMLDISAGAKVTVDSNSVEDNTGVAMSDGSTSAGILVSTFFGGGTMATITRNDIMNNTTGIFVGFDSDDMSVVVANYNNITGNTSFGVRSTNPIVDATFNWWGDDSGPGGEGPGSGDAVSEDVLFCPWLDAPYPGGEPVTDGYVACQNTNINLNGNGVALVTPEIIATEDCGPLLIELEDPQTGRTLGPATEIRVTCDEIGLWYATIYGVEPDDPMGPDTTEICWGELLIEDKSDPEITCNDDVTLGCNVNHTPFTGLRVKEFIWAGEEAFDGDFAMVQINTSSLPDDAVVADVNVSFQVSHPISGDVRVRVESAEGTFPGAFLQSNSCPGSNIDLKLDDESANTVSDACGGGDPALSGTARPNNGIPLSIFDGEDAVGIWGFRFNDVVNNSSNEGTVERVVLQIAYSSEKMGNPMAVDNCEDDLTFTYEDDPMSGFGLCPFGTIRRTWTVMDPNGNSNSCDQLITVQNNVWDRPEILFPDSITLTCPQDVNMLEPEDLEQYNTDSTFFDKPRFRPADHDYCGDLGVTHQDLVFDQCSPHEFKIRRLWIVNDWCDAQFKMRQFQIIKVVDTISPTINCPIPEMTFSVEDDCEIDLTSMLPDPNGISDNCASVNEISITMTMVDNNESTIYSGSLLEAVPSGEYTLTYRATDPCQNFSECDMQIIVEDLEPPTPICDQNTVVGLNHSGTAEVCWPSFDDGSYDNCTDQENLIIRVRRDDDDPWTECVEFTCADTLPVMVQMRVWDDSDRDGIGEDDDDNFNDCMIMVEVQDKTPPRITCPQNLTISCTEDHLDLGLTGEATATDNCEDMLTMTRMDQNNLDPCGVGTVMRTWHVEDMGNRTDQCVQVITKEDNPSERPDIIWPSDITLECLIDPDDLDPEDMTLYNPDDDSNIFYDDPRLDPEDNDYCGQIGFNYVDRIFDICEPNSFKIRRTWSALDLCDPQFTANHIQEIAVIDTMPPYMLEVDGPDTAFITDNTCSATYTATVTASDSCGVVFISNNVNSQTGNDFSQVFDDGTHLIEFTATDNCGNETTVTDTVVVVDQKDPSPACFNTNIAIKSTGIAVLTPQMLNNNSTDNCTDQQDLILELERVNGNGSPTGVREDELTLTCDDLGVFDVRLWVTDEAGNDAYCLSTVTLQDPDSICTSTSNMSDLHLDLSVSNDNPNVGDQITLTVTVTNDGPNPATNVGFTVNVPSDYSPNISNVSFLGSKIGDNVIWTGKNLTVGAQFVGTFDLSVLPPGPAVDFFIFSQITPSDSSDPDSAPNNDDGDQSEDDEDVQKINVNNDPQSANISGHIFTHDGNMVDAVSMSANTDGIPDVMSDPDGSFMFQNMPTGQDYMLTADKNNDPLNGVTTLDLVLIRKHILDLKPFDSPYQHIAADINRSGSITTFDLISLRRVILNLDDNFPNNTSWRFVGADYEFVNPDDPLVEDFREYVMNEDLDGDRMKNDFIGVKIGDINSSVQTASSQSGTVRYEDILTFVVEDRKLQPGNTYKIPVTAKNFNDILGMQFTLAFDPQMVEILPVRPGKDLPGISSDNFGHRYMSAGFVTASWDKSQAVSLEDGKELFVLEIKPLEKALVSEVVSIGSRYTVAEAYDAHYQLFDVQLAFDKKANIYNSEEFALYQNRPNPFDYETTIGFHLPEATDVTLEVLNIHGQIIQKLEGKYTKGYQEIILDTKAMSPGAVYYYRLSAGEYTAAKKMMRLK